MRSRHAAFPLFAVLSWGVMFPVLASALTRVDALNLTTARYVLASAVLLALLLAPRRAWPRLRAGGRAVEVVVLGVLGFAGFNVLTNLALGHAAPQQIALFAATTPLVTQLVRWVRDGVRPPPGAARVLAARPRRRRPGDHPGPARRAGSVRRRRAADDRRGAGLGRLHPRREPVHRLVATALHHAHRGRRHGRDAGRQPHRRPRRLAAPPAAADLVAVAPHWRTPCSSPPSSRCWPGTPACSGSARPTPPCS